MSLDSFQKRGSVINIGIPGRPWISKPSGSLSRGLRLSVLSYFGFGDLLRRASRFLTFPG